MRCRHVRPLLCAVCLGSWIGCGGDSASTPAPAVAPATETTTSAPAVAPVATEATRQIPAAGLPIGDYLPPLDGGQVELPTPTGWTPLPRDSKYVVRFFKDDPNGLPRLEVLVEDKVLGGLSEVSANNVASFAQAVAADLAGKKLVEPVIPIVIGSTAGARYVMKVELRMSIGNIVAERQTVLIPQGGRLYTVHLLVLPNKLLADRDAAYAIVAGWRPAKSP